MGKRRYRPTIGSKVIRIDMDIWDWIDSQAQGLNDTPSKVLRRIMEHMKAQQARDTNH